MIAVAQPSPLWYLTRGTGLVSLILLTIGVVSGVAGILRWAPRGTPRFVALALHRAVSLLVIALLAVHVTTAVLDPFAPIRVIDTVLPFAGAYRPIWLGLGALALDLLVALIATSLLRGRLGLRAWRAVHWAAYACWPIALVHAWGTGSDAQTPWMLAITLGCAAAVIGAIGVRLARGWPANASVRRAAASATLAAVVCAAVWLPLGPLASGWARRSGTPARLLSAPVAAPPRFAAPFTARLRGTLHEGQTASGQVVVDLRLRLAGPIAGALRVRVVGDPARGGGVIMRRSAVSLLPSGAVAPLEGRIQTLDATTLDSLVGDGHEAVRLHVDLRLGDAVVTGTVSGAPVR